LLSLDAIGHTIISPETTPHLWELRTSGGWAPRGGRCDLPAVTYVSHATLATGTMPATHGVTSNRAAAPVPGVVPGWAGQVQARVPTLFDILRDAGVRSAAVCGDQYLVQIMGATAANSVWPPGGVIPEGAMTCPSGYALNEELRRPLLDAVADRGLPFLFAHLNESDTWAHAFGPDHPRALESYVATDALVGEVVAAAHPDWDRLLLIVVSDHGMERVSGETPIDLLASDEVRVVVADVVNEGGAAQALVRDGVTAAQAGDALLRVPGVVAWRETRPGVLLVEGEPGAVFSAGATKHLRGVHGGAGTMVTTAIVAGGHPAVRRVAAAIGKRPPHLGDWAPTMASVLGVPFPTAEGRNLLA
jgi:predicted AlkP superfamily pyrophosphatase or phosphodiesterase